ncbi:hypothetical protein Ptr902_10426 [Pyrenophora tritici-repentis]|uniref:Uncharacterized protein n=1 Tax=Pyrenophora tritici-repentis TaxID=45151 RepID=A0A5M9KTZ9_9PLEO|nr:hypothetical protein PtrV1_10746 [Pyrenophora tritici-repentis]KAF7444068.1 hypothetical protein A1F99_121420 [Pyrenophora tritici-repentis]KAF7566189.1 hypothetical protein PtrM4_145090 [Pyrenophora tritici-repentis]KAI0568724.1 hypothetical protein Alg215_12024 [Pyrenophora tritici-repentis]KAI0569584.1 hypothetical protein Alg130_11582 [Pyrenophora tritici-repentis]
MKLLTLSLALSVFSIVYAHSPKQIQVVKRSEEIAKSPTSPNWSSLKRRWNCARCGFTDCPRDHKCCHCPICYPCDG